VHAVKQSPDRAKLQSLIDRQSVDEWEERFTRRFVAVVAPSK